METPLIDSGEPSQPRAGLPRATVRRPRRWLVVLFVALLAALVVRSLARNSSLQWSTVGHYLLAHAILSGVVVTIELTVIAQVIGTVLGSVLALGRLSANPVSRALASAYLWLFRGTPVLVQLIFWYNLALLFPHLTRFRE